MFLLYNLVFLLYALFYLPYLILTNRWYAGFGMRFGFFSGQIISQMKARPNIWLHAVSVGEVMAADGFIDQLGRKYPGYQILMTVTTKTGYALACERLKNKALVIPSPVDFSFVAGRFVDLINPKIYMAVETEIWPNLFRKLYERKIFLVIVNGRISDNAFGRYKAVRFWLQGVLNQVSVWCMQSQKDAQRIMELGADPSRVVTTGNIKFDEDPLSLGSSYLSTSYKGGLWWVAGSTHPGEEEIVLDVYAKLLKVDPKWRLVIVPRHIERAGQIRDLIKVRGFKDGQVILVDTIGQLRFLYSIASLVFVGKSLCVGGGHNIIEPAVYGKAIVIGPMVQNFQDIVACFKEKNAIVQVDNAHDFENAVLELCADASKRDALGAAAKEVIAANQGATQRSLERLAEFLK